MTSTRELPALSRARGATKRRTTVTRPQPPRVAAPASGFRRLVVFGSVDAAAGVLAARPPLDAR